MTSVTPALLVEALQDWGCDPTPYEPDGVAWHRHTTPGAFHPAGVIHHHTAGSASLLTSETAQRAMLRLLRHGTVQARRAAAAGTALDEDPAVAAAIAEHLEFGFAELHDLPSPDPAARAAGIPGPLCHGAPAMVPGSKTRARVHLIGWGNVNHAGVGSSRTLSAVRSGTYDGRGPGRDDTDGNPWFWGWEYMHPGDRTAWPDPLVEVGHRAACAICEVSGWSLPSWPGSNVEHREWTARKIDRSWRGNLRAAIRRTAEEGKLTTVDLTKEAIRDVAAATAKAVAGHRVPNLDPATGKPLEGAGITIEAALSQVERWEDQERGAATKALAAVTALDSKVEALTALVAALAQRLT